MCPEYSVASALDARVRQVWCAVLGVRVPRFPRAGCPGACRWGGPRAVPPQGGVDRQFDHPGLRGRPSPPCLAQKRPASTFSGPGLGGGGPIPCKTRLRASLAFPWPLPGEAGMAERPAVAGLRGPRSGGAILHARQCDIDEIIGLVG